MYYSYHCSKFDTILLNKALEKSIKDKEFMNSNLNLLKNSRFPLYRDKIIEHVQKFTNDDTTIALFYTLSDLLEFKDIHQIKNILQSNIIAKNSPSRTKNSDELNVNPLTTKQNQKSPTSDSNESLSMMLCENIPVINVVNLFLQETIYMFIKNLKDNIFYIN